MSLINKYHVAAGVETPVPFQNSCYASCRDPSHGVERWTSVTPWSKNSGKVSGGHNRPDECKAMIAAELAGQPAGSTIELYPGDQGMSESSSKDIFGHVDYTYYCNGMLKVGPVYVKKSSLLRAAFGIKPSSHSSQKTSFTRNALISSSRERRLLICFID